MDYSLLLKKLPPNFDVLIPFQGFDKELLTELSVKSTTILAQHPKIIVTEKLASKPLWAQDWWPDSHSLQIDTPKAAAEVLKSLNVMGCYYFIDKNLLASKVAQNLKQLELKRLKYKPGNSFNFKFFAWTVLGEQLIYCEKPTSRFPFGWHEFNEDKQTPPNRAYLKLWEVFSVVGIYPGPQDSVIEIGASPGGWSWVLSQMTKQVYAIDRSPLEDPIDKIPNIAFEARDAFKLDPKDYADCTWFFSDIICTPEKLLETVQSWLAHSHIQNYVCTIKFKGECDYKVLQKFSEIPNSKLIHLYQNKNEVTWIRLEPTE